jgi:hypothetical protein
MTRPLLHVVKAHLLAGGVAERECFCGCACEAHDAHQCPITALQTTDIQMYLACSYWVLGNVAQLANMPPCIRVSNKLCQFGWPEQKGVRLQKPSSAVLANDDRSMGLLVEKMSWSSEQILLNLGLFIWLFKAILRQSSLDCVEVIVDSVDPSEMQYRSGIERSGITENPASPLCIKNGQV